MTIDFRVRPPYKGFLAMHFFTDRERTSRITRQLGMAPARSMLEASMELFLGEMGEAGIAAAVVAGRKAVPPWASVDNQDVADLVREHPGKFYGYAGVDLTSRESARRDLEEATELGLVGVSLDPGFAPEPMCPDHRRLYPVYERCLELRLPVMITASHHAGPETSWGDPMYIDRVANDFPTLPIVVAHGCWPYVMQVLAVAHKHRNVYIAPDFYMVNMPGALDYVRAANFYLEDRFLFATSYPFGPLVDTVREFKALPFTERALGKALHDNAARLLNISQGMAYSSTGDQEDDRRFQAPSSSQGISVSGLVRQRGAHGGAGVQSWSGTAFFTAPRLHGTAAAGDGGGGYLHRRCRRSAGRAALGKCLQRRRGRDRPPPP